MHPRHEDDAAFVRLIDLHLPAWVLVAADLCACCDGNGRKVGQDAQGNRQDAKDLVHH
jgi:hypothetical protein